MASNDYDAGYADGRKDARERIAELEKALDAFHKDPENPDAAVLRYKAIASKAINEQVEILKEYEARISELEARINYIEAHVEGLVRTHSQFAAAAEGSWSGKKQRVRAAEASQILAFIRKEKSAARAAYLGEKE